MGLPALIAQKSGHCGDINYDNRLEMDGNGWKGKTKSESRFPSGPEIDGARKNRKTELAKRCWSPPLFISFNKAIKGPAGQTI